MRHLSPNSACVTSIEPCSCCEISIQVSQPYRRINSTLATNSCLLRLLAMLDCQICLWSACQACSFPILMSSVELTYDLRYLKSYLTVRTDMSTVWMLTSSLMLKATTSVFLAFSLPAFLFHTEKAVLCSCNTF